MNKTTNDSLKMQDNESYPRFSLSSLHFRTLPNHKRGIDVRAKKAIQRPCLTVCNLDANLPTRLPVSSTSLQFTSFDCRRN